MTLSLTSSLARLSLSAASTAVASSSRACLSAPSSAHRHASIRMASTASAAVATSASSRFSLGSLKPAQPKKTMKRLGRGPGSGRGGTATRGHKGQKARRGNGKPTPGFEGGQTPLMRRYPKRGFTNIHAKEFAPLNVDRLQAWIDRGLLDASKPITARELLESRCVHGVKDGIKLLGDGAKHLTSPVNLVVSRASASAIDAVERAGGSIETRYYTDTTLRALIKPHKFEGKVLPLPADPTTKRDLVYYANARNRGYLAKQAALGQLDLSPRSSKASKDSPAKAGSA